MSTYLAAHSHSETGHGLNEVDRTAHECGVQPAELPHLLQQLAALGVLNSWRITADTDDVYWDLRAPQ